MVLNCICMPSFNVKNILQFLGNRACQHPPSQSLASAYFMEKRHQLPPHSSYTTNRISYDLLHNVLLSRARFARHIDQPRDIRTSPNCPNDIRICTKITTKQINSYSLLLSTSAASIHHHRLQLINDSKAKQSLPTLCCWRFVIFQLSNVYPKTF